MEETQVLGVTIDEKYRFYYEDLRQQVAGSVQVASVDRGIPTPTEGQPVEVKFVTSDELLEWVWEQRMKGEDVLAWDDPRNRSVGFSGPDSCAYIQITDVKRNPPTPEGLEPFGERPEDVPNNPFQTIEGRQWLAGMVQPDQPLSGDVAVLKDIWLEESEEYRPVDQGELPLVRPSSKDV